MSAPARGALPFSTQLRKLRSCACHPIVHLLAAFGAGAGATWYFRTTVFALLFVPAGGTLSASSRPVFTVPTEMLNATIHLTMMGGAVAAFPVALLGAFRFVRRWLPKKTRRFVALLLLATLLCFAGGSAFAYFVMLPTGMRFLLHFGAGVADPMIRISEYMGLVTAMMFWLGIIFEIPPVMYLLAKSRILGYERFRKFRRYVFPAALIFGMVITPTVDVLNQLMVAVPITVLYEVGLFLAWLARPKPPGYRGPIRRLKDCIRRVVGWLTWPGRMAWRQARRGWRALVTRLRGRRRGRG